MNTNNDELQFRYEFIERVDHIKNNWYVWTVVRTRNSNGISHIGSIQADGDHNLIAHETFKIED